MVFQRPAGEFSCEVGPTVCAAARPDGRSGNRRIEAKIERSLDNIIAFHRSGSHALGDAFPCFLELCRPVGPVYACLRAAAEAAQAKDLR